MTSDVAAQRVTAAGSSPAWAEVVAGARANRVRTGLMFLLVAQAAWVALLCARGWFYQDDLRSLDYASGRSLDWGYLTAPVDDHLVPGLRLVFWIQEHIAALSYAPTVVARVVLQTLAVYLLYRLLVLLCGERPGVLVLTALYALNPLIVCNLTWLTTAAGLVPAQLAAVLAVHHHVRYTVTGRLRDAAYSGVALLVGVCFWEKTAIVVLLLPVLSAGYLMTGSPRSRARQLVSRWRGWLMTVVPPLIFAAYFLSHHYGGSARTISTGQLLGVTGTAWWQTLAPAFLGGPWAWTASRGIFVSFTAPPLWLCIAAQVLVAGMVVLGWRRTGARSIWAWSIPLISVVVGTALVAIGRYQTYGDQLATTIRYSFDVTIALVLGAALALLPSTPAAIRARADARAPIWNPRATPAPPGLPFARAFRGGLVRSSARVALAALAVFAVVNAGLSGWRFEHRWVQDPTHAYVDRLTRSLRIDGPTVNLYDTPVPNGIVPTFLGATMHVSRVIGWTHTPARFDQTDSRPLVADGRGRLRTATFLQVAHAQTQGSNPLCNDYLSGMTTRTQLLIGTPSKTEWFFHLEYFQQRPTTVYLRLLDGRGKSIVPIGGSRLTLRDKLGAITLRLPYSAPRQLQVRSDSASTSLCLTQAVVGYPFPRRGH